MKQYFLKIVVLGACVFFVASCQKSSQPSTPFTEIEGKWKLIQTATDNNNNGILDREELTTVAAGDVEFLQLNKDLTGDQNITMADSVTTNYPFTWNLTGNDSVLVRYELGDTITSVIYDINNTDLTLQSNTMPVTSWYVYVKQ
jgi:hypothetical protein